MHVNDVSFTTLESRDKSHGATRPMCNSASSGTESNNDVTSATRDHMNECFSSILCRLERVRGAVGLLLGSY